MHARAAPAAAARQHLEALAAAPRPAGGPEESKARTYCVKVLTAAGFEVREEPFSYSAFPGRIGTPLFGAVCAVLIATAGHVGWRGSAGIALGLLTGGSIALGIAARWLGRHGVLSFPWMRARSVNLVATRGQPTLWLLAHLDSKSQPVPIVVRAVAVMVVLVTLVAAIILAAVQMAGAEVRSAWPWITGVGVLASLPVAASVVQMRSPGAVDDASGVGTLLMVAESLSRSMSLGIVLTSAEELGLAGARAWVQGRTASRAINIDGVDDSGDLRLTWTRQRPSHLIDALVANARDAGLAAHAARLLPGALLDGVALADAGWQVVTVSRGTLGTVARIHMPDDSLDRMRGDGMALTASIIRATAIGVA
ncbi:MAG: M28 family peptidase [Gemmatimonadaceae bacterium]